MNLKINPSRLHTTPVPTLPANAARAYQEGKLPKADIIAAYAALTGHRVEAVPPRIWRQMVAPQCLDPNDYAWEFTQDDRVLGRPMSYHTMLVTLMAAQP